MADAADYPVDLYAALHRGHVGDIEFYLSRCEGADSVLELGCGEGRVTRALNHAGHDVVGIDIAPDAVAAATASGVEAYCCDISDFELKRRFDVVIAPYNTLYCLLSEQQLRTCFDRVAAHLADGGRFIFDVYAAEHLELPEYRTLDPAEAWVGTVDFAGEVWDVFERSRRLADERLIEVCYRHATTSDTPEIEATIVHRYFLENEIKALLLNAGLRPGPTWDAFEQGEAESQERLLIVEANLSTEQSRDF